MYYVFGGIIAVYTIILIILIRNNIANNRTISGLYRPMVNEYVSIEKGDTILSILDNRIEDILNTYVIMNLGYKDTLYISTEMQDEINNIILECTIKSLPNSYISVLSLLYAEPYVEIDRRIKLAVMNYVIENNGQYRE